MKIIIKDTNEVKDVSFGYAVNYLIPQGLAVAATPQAIRRLKEEQKAKSKKRKEKSIEEKDLLEKLRGKVFAIEKKVGEGKKLFGSVTKQDILKALGVDRGLVEILLDAPIKTLGKHTVSLKIGARKIKVKVSVKKSTTNNH